MKFRGRHRAIPAPLSPTPERSAHCFPTSAALESGLLLWGMGWKGGRWGGKDWADGMQMPVNMESKQNNSRSQPASSSYLHNNIMAVGKQEAWLSAVVLVLHVKNWLTLD